MKSININRTKRLREEPHTGHNRWHPDITPIVEVDEGEEVILQTRDALDLQLNPTTTEADFTGIEAGAGKCNNGSRILLIYLKVHKRLGKLRNDEPRRARRVR